MNKDVAIVYSQLNNLLQHEEAISDLEIAEKLQAILYQLKRNKTVRKPTHKSHNQPIGIGAFANNPLAICYITFSAPLGPVTITDANESFMQLFGYSLSELQEIPVNKLYNVDNKEDILFYIGNLFQYGSIAFETEILTSTNQTRIVEVNCSLLSHTPSKQCLAILRDITATKANESAIQYKEQIIREITMSTYESGQKFFNSLVQQLTIALNADFAFIAKIPTDGSPLIKTLSVSKNGVLMPALEYRLDCSPCRDVMGHSVISFASGVRDRYPEGEFLRNNNIEGYIGIPLFFSTHEPLGIMVAMYTTTIADIDFAESIMQMFATRAGSEIERMDTEQALIQSEKRYQHITESVSDYIVKTYINEGKVTASVHSPSSLSVTGYQTEDYENDSYLWYKMIYEDDRRAVAEKIFNIIRGIENKAFEHRIHHKNGKTRWIRNTPVLFYNEKAQIVEYDAIISDITQLKITELKMLEQEKQYKLLFNEMNSCCALQEMIFDENNNALDFRFIDINPALEKFIGLPKEQILGHTVREIFANTPQQWIERYGNIVKSGIAENFEDYFLPLQRYIRVAAYSSNNNFFAVIFDDITDRKIAELALNESEERYRKLVDLSPDAICVFSLNGKLEYINKEGLRIIGCSTEDELLGSNILRFIHPCSIRMLKQLSQKILINNEVNTLEELTLLKTDGSNLFVEINASQVVFNNKQVVQVIVRDVTDKKNAEAALRKSEEHFALAMDAVNDGIFEWDIENEDFYFSTKNYVMLGYSKDAMELNPTTWNALVHPDDREKLVTNLIDHIQSNSSYYELEYRVKTKSGTYKWILERAKVQSRSKANKPIRIIGIHTDIDARKQAEEILKSEKDFVSRLMQISPVGIVSADTNFKISYANDQAIAILDLLQTDNNTFESPYYKYFTLTGLEIPFEKLPIFNKALYHKPIINERLVLQWPDGSRKALSVNMNPIFNADNEHEGAIYTISDISKQVENEQQLRRAKEQAEESDKLKSAFLANMSHEIRTPMNGIIGFSGLLSREDLTKEKKSKYIQIIQNSTNQLLTIITDILDISKLEAGQLIITDNQFNINNLLDELLAQFEIDKRDKEKPDIALIVHKDLQPKAAEIKTDRSRISQVLANLIGNALKFTEVGSIEFGYKLIHKEKLVFFIKDTGIGIAQEKQQIIFERFRQVDDSTTRRFGGTGLGLTICRGIVELLGGKIWVESNAAQGSVFYFSIPYRPASGDIEEENDTVIEDYEHVSWKGKKILIVEDVEDNYLLLKEIIDETEADTLYVTDGISAISCVQNHTDIDLVLMDIQLPDINGYEATRQIKQLRPSLPVVAQTAYGLIGDREKALQAGCDEYISKPIIRSIFMTTLHALLSH